MNYIYVARSGFPYPYPRGLPMKRLPFAFAAYAAASFSLMFAACGDEVTRVEQPAMTAVETEAELPECGEDNNGSFVIAKDKQKVFVCYSGKWFALNGSDGSQAPAPEQKGEKGDKGTDGKPGSSGTSCTGVPFKSGDSTGFKIVCGTDTLGVIMNGKDGVDGADGNNGRHGLVPGLAKKLSKRMKRGVNTAAFDSPGKKFKGFDDNGIVSDYSLWDDPTHFDRLEKKHFKMIADQGFDNIRIQVRWDAHFTGESGKCQIDPEFMKQVQWAVENTIQNGMIAVVNEQDIIFQMQVTGDNAKGNGFTYEKASPCEKAIYTQLANTMSIYSPDSVIIELPNEPTLEPHISARQWNNLVDSLIQIIHGIDPARVIMVGSRNFYSKDYLHELELDNSDGLLIASFHYYDPFEFTSAGCGAAIANVDTCGNVAWKGNASQRRRIYNDFKAISDWSKANGNIPVYLGEYGTKYLIKDSIGAEKWISYVTQTADMFGFTPCIYSFGGGHHIYNFKKEAWDEFKVRALFNPKYDIGLNLDNYDLAKLTSMPIENFESEGFPGNEYFGNNWWFYAENATAKNSNGQAYSTASDNLSTFISNNAHADNGFYGRFTVSAPGGDRYPAFGLGINIITENQNMSTIKAISFWAKGSGNLKLALATTYAASLSETVDSWVGDFAAEVKLSSEWTQYVIWAEDFIPESYSELDKLQAEWSEHSDGATQICFRNGSDIGPESNTTVEWFIDDIEFYK